MLAFHFLEIQEAIFNSSLTFGWIIRTLDLEIRCDDGRKKEKVFVINIIIIIVITSYITNFPNKYYLTFYMKNFLFRLIRNLREKKERSSFCASAEMSYLEWALPCQAPCHCSAMLCFFVSLGGRISCDDNYHWKKKPRNHLPVEQ